jgi:hypothetical protein
MSLSFSPFLQTTGAGLFNIESDGLIAGTAYPDPAARFALSGGWFNPATGDTIPMYGGVALTESIPSERPPVTNVDVSLGTLMARAATAGANIQAFSVFDQNYAGITSPQNPVPVVDKGAAVHFYRVGCGIRLALAISPSLVSLEGGLTTQAVGWDFVNQQIIAGTGFPGKILAIKSTNCMVPVYSSTTGFVTWNYNGACAVVLLQ